MTIRFVETKDFQAWFELWEGYNAFYKRTVAIEMTEKTWERFLNPAESVYALVAEVDGKVRGFATYLFHRHTALIDDVCYLQDLFTDESCRGRGIGGALIEAVSVRAKERGSKKVYWMTHEKNDVARKLYDRIAKHSGFIIYGMS